ncbi:MAG: Bug family tripartite tricarboxylate transporter substrate binding protein [Pigmentiphaga sp.]
MSDARLAVIARMFLLEPDAMFPLLVRNPLLAILLTFVAAAVSAQGYPEKSVRMIVPYPAGGPTDVTARSLAAHLSELWKQSVYVENKPGATGSIGARDAINSKPDGYTLLLTASAALVLYPSMIDNPPFDVNADFTPITSLSYSDLVLVVNSKLRVNSVQELIAYGREHPGEMFFGSAGNGAVNHVAGELFNRSAELNVTHVPYKGDGLALNDLLAGQVTMSFMSAQLALPQIQAGSLKALAVAGGTRMAALPEVPTMKEAGVPDFELRAWNGLLGPAGMETEVVQTINNGVIRVMSDATVRQQLSSLGFTIDTSTPEAFAERLRNESARWDAFIHAANISID